MMRVPDHVVSRAFEGETVLLNLETGQYHGLNRTAQAILDVLLETGDADTTAHRIAEHFGVPRDRVADDVRALRSALLERGLIEDADDGRAGGG